MELKGLSIAITGGASGLGLATARRVLDAAAALPGKVFHGGTKLVGTDTTTNGGRVLCAVGLGKSVHDAQQAAYALADRIHWNGIQYRRDIGYRAIAREQARSQ